MRRAFDATLVLTLLLVFTGGVRADTGPAPSDAGDTGLDGGDVAADTATDTASGDVSGSDVGDTGVSMDGGTDVAMDDAGDVAADTAGDTSVADGGGDVGMDVEMDVATDAAMDGGDDAGADTGNAMDTAGDVDSDVDMDVTPDVQVDTGGDGGPADAAVGDTTDGDAGATYVFSGRVDVVDRSNDSGVSVFVEKTGDGATVERQTTTDSAGQFRLEALPAGEYRVELTLEGYVKRVDQFALRGDRAAEYELFPDQSAALDIVIGFREGAEPPATVDVRLIGPRGTRQPDEPLEVTDGTARWQLDTLPTGRWTLILEADGFRATSVPFDLEGSAEMPPKMKLTVEMVPTSVVEVEESDGGCNCHQTGGGLPDGVPTAIMAFVIVGALLRKRRTE